MAINPSQCLIFGEDPNAGQVSAGGGHVHAFVCLCVFHCGAGHGVLTDKTTRLVCWCAENVELIDADAAEKLLEEAREKAAAKAKKVTPPSSLLPPPSSLLPLLLCKSFSSK